MSKATTEDQFKFLISCIRFSNNGKVDFGEVAKECSIVSKGAAAKRYERLMKAHDLKPSSGTVSRAPARTSSLKGGEPSRKKAKLADSPSASTSAGPAADDDEEIKTENTSQHLDNLEHLEHLVVKEESQTGSPLQSQAQLGDGIQVTDRQATVPRSETPLEVDAEGDAECEEFYDMPICTAPGTAYHAADFCSGMENYGFGAGSMHGHSHAHNGGFGTSMGGGMQNGGGLYGYHDVYGLGGLGAGAGTAGADAMRVAEAYGGFERGLNSGFNSNSSSGLNLAGRGNAGGVGSIVVVDDEP